MMRRPRTPSSRTPDRARVRAAGAMWGSAANSSGASAAAAAELIETRVWMAVGALYGRYGSRIRERRENGKRKVHSLWHAIVPET